MKTDLSLCLCASVVTRGCAEMVSSVSEMYVEIESVYAEMVSKVCAPSKANVNKPANPARTKPNQQFGTEPGT